VKQLAQSGIPANAIHGNKSQPQRERALGEFKAGKVKILDRDRHRGARNRRHRSEPRHQFRPAQRLGAICPPDRPTARAGAGGIAIAFCAEDERAYLKGIERLTRQRSKWCRCRRISSPRRTGSRPSAPLRRSRLWPGARRRQ
jgi:ATP-dependent RNA helicase RhlE